MKNADPIWSPGRSLSRTLAVVSLASFVLVVTWLNVLIVNGFRFTGTVTRSDFVVQSVLPDSSAAKAGLRAGDRIDASALNVIQRLTLFNDRVTRPSESVDFSVIRNGARVPISVAATNLPATPYAVVIKRASATIFIIIASLLVLLRPSRMLWGFFLFALSSAWGSPLIFSWSPAWLQVLMYEVFLQIIYGAFLIAGLWMFVARFPEDRAEGWRAWFDRAAVPVGVVYACAAIIVTGLTFAGIEQPASIGRFFVSAGAGASPRVPIVAAIGLGMLCLLGAYAHLSAASRQRLKWVFGGFAISLVALAYANVSSNLPGLGWPHEWILAGFGSDVLVAVDVVIPLAVAYAVLTHRVLDINFVISRALAYATLTSLIVIVFALIDLFVVRRLVATNLGLVIELIAAIALGFWLNSLHHRVDSFIDRVFFRHRYRAQLRLDRIATALPHAGSLAAVNDFLVAGPLDALDLASAAVFARRTDGSYCRERSAGWPDDSTSVLAPDDALVLHLRSHLQAFRISEVHWPRGDLPRANAYPALALPIVVRNDVVAIAFYGAHNNGADLDPDEIRIVSQLAVAAGAAYDHLEAAALRGENESLRTRLAAVEQPA